MSANQIKVKIEKGIKLPPGRCALEGQLYQLRSVLDSMQAGDSFLWKQPSHNAYKAANQLGIKISTRKINGSGYRIWRITP